MIAKLHDILHRNRGKLIVLTALALFFFFYFFPSILITVQPGQVGVKFSRLFGGTVLDKVYPDGLYVLWPWDKLFRYDVRVQGFQRTVSVLCSNGLNVQVNIALRCHPDPERLPKLHLQIGPEYLDKLVIPVTVSSVRDVVGQYKPEELYSTASQEMQNAILVEIIREIGRAPLIIDSVVVESIELPAKIRDAIERKLEFQQILLAYNYRLVIEHREVERKVLEAEGVAKYNQKVRDSLSDSLLTWQGIKATKELAESDNAKIVVIGNSRNGLPVILDMGDKPVGEKTPEKKGGDKSALESKTGASNAPAQSGAAESTILGAPSPQEAVQSSPGVPASVDIPAPPMPSTEEPRRGAAPGGRKTPGRAEKP
jgi:regulator of protease activity HflC (stomatin/prohibitin superfamily)